MGRPTLYPRPSVKVTRHLLVPGGWRAAGNERNGHVGPVQYRPQTPVLGQF